MRCGAGVRRRSRPPSGGGRRQPPNATRDAPRTDGAAGAPADTRRQRGIGAMPPPDAADGARDVRPKSETNGAPRPPRRRRAGGAFTPRAARCAHPRRSPRAGWGRGGAPRRFSAQNAACSIFDAAAALPASHFVPSCQPLKVLAVRRSEAAAGAVRASTLPGERRRPKLGFSDNRLTGS